MNDKTNARSFDNNEGASGCGRKEELVAYLYGEAKPEEAKRFRQHLTNCLACRDEHAAFGGVREAVGEWRTEVLDSIPSLDIERAFAPSVDVRPLVARKRSAAAALREFFSLSPLWLRAGALAAALVFCALAFLTISRAEVRWDSNGIAFRTVRQKVVKEPVPVIAQTGYAPEQVKAMIDEQVNSKLAEERAKWEAENGQHVAVLEAALKQQRNGARNNTATASQPGSRRYASGGSSRSQLAEAKDEQDYFSTKEERVPRLTDLLGAVNAPQ